MQFTISMLFSSIQPIDWFLSGATIPDQSGPESNGNEGVLCIPHNPCITGTSLSDCLVSYIQYTGCGERGFTLLQRCSQCILQPQLTEQY